MMLSACVHRLRSENFRLLLGLMVLGFFASGMQAGTPPAAPPLTIDPVLPNLFYGASPSNDAPVLVFVHGLSGSYQDWIESKNCPTTAPTGPVCKGSSNTMYDLSYQAGFRTVFMSLSPDNSNNTSSIQTNAAVLQGMFPRILSTFNTSKVYFVCHSKGGLDLQSAIATPEWIGMALAVITMGTPNQGDALSDWCYSPASDGACAALGLQNPAVQSMEIASVQALRVQWDPIFQEAAIPFYTLSGSTYDCPAFQTTCSTALTGPILTSITGGTSAPPNDGLVDHPESLLSNAYAMEIGIINVDHFELRLGTYSFNYVQARVLALDNEQPGFTQVATGGFGDQHNSWGWSMTWFNNMLYVGTGREVNCVTAAESYIQLGLPDLYPPSIGDCTPDYHYLPLQAEIWQYNPVTNVWTRVFQSPNSLTTTATDGSTVATARDIGFRSLSVVTEPTGVQALYAGGVTSGEMFETSFGTWPPPRILRSTDGVTWAPLPQDAGTFLGDLTLNGTSEYPIYSIRSGQQLNGVLFLQVGDFPGVGRVICSVAGANPKDGDNNFTWAGPTAEDMPVWILSNFNNFVYGGTGNPPGAPTNTYGVYKTDGTGTPPYTWNPIITNGAYATGLVADYAMSLEIFSDPQYCPDIGCLYVGTDAANEMVRIHPDMTGTVPVDSVDSWDLVIGDPRMVPEGDPGAGIVIDPVSGIGQYFDNGFTGHFWNMGVGGQGLYMGTWDWSCDHATVIPEDGEPSFSLLWSQEYGTDIWRTPDGVHWSFVSKAGLGDGNNEGGRSFSSTPYGLYMGTSHSVGGTQIFLLDNTTLDLNRDGVIDERDVKLMTAKLNTPAKPHDPMDLNQDGMITSADVELLRTQCTHPGCAAPRSKPANTTLAAPVLYSAPGPIAKGSPISLSWSAVSGASDYLLYRIALSPSQTTAPPGVNGTVVKACANATGTKAALCSQLPAVKSANSSALFGYPGPPILLTRVTNPAYTENAINNLQALYFVRAEDANGDLSPPSNVAGGPSLAAQ